MAYLIQIHPYIYIDTYILYIHSSTNIPERDGIVHARIIKCRQVRKGHFDGPRPVSLVKDGLS